VEAGLCCYKKILNKRKMARLQSTIAMRYKNNKTVSRIQNPQLHDSMGMMCRWRVNYPSNVKSHACHMSINKINVLTNL